MVSRWETVAGVDQHTAVSRFYRDGTKKGALIVPGHTQDRQWWWDLDASNLAGAGFLRGLTDDFNIPLASIGCYSNWGNAVESTLLTTLRSNVQSSGLFAAGKVHLIGVSAGGLSVLNWAISNPTLVQSINLIIPVSDLQDTYDYNRNGFTTSIASAYGGGRPADAYNPIKNTAALAGIPIQLFYSTTDNVTLEASQLAFAAATNTTLRSMGAVGHYWGVPWGPGQVGSFIAAND